MATKKTVTDPKVTARADELNAVEVNTQIANTRTAIEALLSSLTNTTLAGLRSYDDLKQAIDAKKAELQALFGQEAAAKTLAELEADIQATRNNWDTERAERARLRQADEDAWRFGFNQRKLAAEAQQTDEARVKARAEEQRVYERELNWKRREETVAAAENELKALREQAATFDIRVKAASEKEVAIATNALKRTFEHEKQVSEITSKNNEARLNDRIQLLEAQLVSKTSEISNLQRQLIYAYPVHALDHYLLTGLGCSHSPE